MTNVQLIRNADDAAHPAPIRILFPFEGGVVGGSHISALTLIAALDRQRFTPDIVLHHGSGPLAELLTARGQPYELLPPRLSSLRPRDLLRNFARRVGFARSRGVQVVHTNEGIMHAAWAPVARLAGARLLWHHRGHPRARGVRYLAPWFADRMLSVSEFAAPRPGLLSAAPRCTVVRSPFDLSQSVADRSANAAARRAELGVPADCVLLGFFGNLAARKRPLVFVDAVARVIASTDRPVVGAIFGDTLDPGLDREVVARAAALGLGDRIRMMGFRAPIAPWIAACDANLVTAVDEPFGRTLIEAMLLGTPVIAAASGGNGEAIRDGITGFLVPPDDPESFARAVVRLLAPGVASAISTAAAAEARQRFGIEGHVEAVSAVYRELAAA